MSFYRILTIQPVDVVLWCYHLNKTSLAELLNYAIYFLIGIFFKKEFAFVKYFLLWPLFNQWILSLLDWVMIRWFVTLTFKSLDRILCCYNSNVTFGRTNLQSTILSFLNRILQKKPFFCVHFYFGHALLGVKGFKDEAIRTKVFKNISFPLYFIITCFFRKPKGVPKFHLIRSALNNNIHLYRANSTIQFSNAPYN